MMRKTNVCLFWMCLMLVAGLAFAEPRLWPDTSRVLQQRLEGSWQLDESLTKRLTGTPGWQIAKLVIKVDNSVLANIPEERKKDFPSTIYVAGSAILSSKGKPDMTQVFVLFDQAGGHVMTLLSDREGEPFGKAENVRLVLAHAKDQKNDILLLGASPSPMAAFSRGNSRK